ncbi:MAG TPA: hypothetical protein VEB40_00940 [Flavipsychrobacter sp.]|nr:hypothetical protein [Flavipsychrobacter sp.]
MKKIVLKQFTHQEGKYRVHLGNGTTHSFSSKRKLVAFLNQTNKFLTTQLFEVHGIYMAVWQEYQRSWFYFGWEDNKQYTLHYLDQRKCEESLQGCEQAFVMAWKRHDWANGTHSAFMHMEVAIDCCKEVVGILLHLHRKRSSTVEIYRLNALLKQLVLASSTLSAYGQLDLTHNISYSVANTKLLSAKL